MSAYEGGQNHLPDIPAERWRAMYEEAAAELERVRADLARAEADARVGRDFSDLWYFVMDEEPGKFEKIVAEWTPSRWLDQAQKLRAEKRGRDAIAAQGADHE